MSERYFEISILMLTNSAEEFESSHQSNLSNRSIESSNFWDLSYQKSRQNVPRDITIYFYTEMSVYRDVIYSLDCQSKTLQQRLFVLISDSWQFRHSAELNLVLRKFNLDQENWHGRGVHFKEPVHVQKKESIFI